MHYKTMENNRKCVGFAHVLTHPPFLFVRFSKLSTSFDHHLEMKNETAKRRTKTNMKRDSTMRGVRFSSFSDEHSLFYFLTSRTQ